MTAEESLSRRERLEAARDRLTGLLAGAEANTAPSISRELRAVLAELETIPSAKGSLSVQDELKRRRDERLAASSDRARTAE